MTSVLETFEYGPAVFQVMRDVFETMLSYSVLEVPAPNRIPPRETVTSTVYFNGEWSGAAILECSQAQAFLFTEQLMKIPAPVHLDEDASDAMGEIVNMIGGNLKSLLPAGVSLSVPQVVIGSMEPRLEFSHQVQFSYRTDNGPISLTLGQINSDPAINVPDELK